MTITYDKTVLLKRGNTAVSVTYTGPLGEVTVDTDLDTLRVHDGVTPGGHILANVSQINSNINLSAVNANVAAANLTIALTNANIGAFQTYANIEFTDLWANAAAQTIALDNFIAGTGFATSANLGAYQIYANANIGAYQNFANITFAELSANLGNIIVGTGFVTQTELINNVNIISANIGSFQTFSNANAAIQSQALFQANINNAANVIAANASISALQTNAAIQQTQINALDANIGSLITGTGFASLDQLNANVGILNTKLRVNVEIISANLGAYQIFANANSIAQSNSIDTLLANAGTQATSINSMTANIGAYQIFANANVVAIQANLGSYQTFANANITTIQANLGAYQTYANANVVAIQANLGSYQVYANANAASQALALDNLTGNAATQGSLINTINANVAAANAAVTTLTANAATQSTQITLLNANVTAANVLIASLQSNAAVQANILDVLSGNAVTQQSELAALVANAAAQGSELTVLIANASAQAGNLTTLISNAATQATAIDSITANIGAYQTYANANAAVQAATLTTLVANAAAQALEIDSLTGNAATQGSLINTLDSNLGSATTSITTLQSNAATQAVAISSINANIGAYQTYANANAAVQAASITTLVANAAAQALDIDSLTANAATQGAAINTLNANIGAYQTFANSNAATQATAIDSITANIGAYQTYANANAAVQATGINTINANVGAYQTYANANVVVIQANLGAFQTYANAQFGPAGYSNTNVAAYLNNENITSANIGAYQTYANATFGTSNYGNANVATYLSAFNGNILPSANVTYSLGSSTRQWKDLWVSNNTIYIGNVPITVSNGNLLVNGNLVTGSGGSGTDDVLRANVGAYQTFANANAATQATSINTFNANLGAYQTFANANAATQATSINTFNANLGAYQTFANSNAATQSTAIATLQTQVYANANVAEYLPTYSGNVRAEYLIMSFGGIITTGASPAPSISGFSSISTTGNAFNEGNISASGNLVANRGAYITGNVTAGNLTITGNLDQPNRGFGNGPGTNLYITAGHTQGCSIPGGNTIISGGLGYGGIAHNGGNVTLRTGDYYSKQWNFDYAGNLTLPTTANSDTSIGTAFNTNPPGHTVTLKHNGGVSGGSGGELKFDYGNAQIKVVKDAGTTQTWTFGTNGTTQFPNSLILAPVSQSITMQSDQYSQLMWENANVTVAPNMPINSNFYVAQDSATLDIGYRDGSSTQVIKSWYWNADGTLTLPTAGRINFDYLSISSDANVSAFYAPAGNVQLAAGIGDARIVASSLSDSKIWNFGANANLTLPQTGYLRVGSGIVAGFASSPAPVISGFSSISAENFTFLANGVNILSTVGAGAYGNTQVAAYLLNFDGDIEFTSSTAKIGNVDVITVGDHIRSPAYQFSNGVSIFSGITGTYSNTNVAAYLTLGVTTANLTATGNITQQSAYYETYGNISNTGGNLTCNFNLGTVFYAALTANVTANFTNVNAIASTVTGATIIVDQGATAYRVANVQVNGVNQTIQWVGATVGTGTASNTDIMSFSLIHLGGAAYRVLGQISNYG